MRDEIAAVLLRLLPNKGETRTLWEARPAANAGLLPAQKPKASPRGRASRKIKSTASALGQALHQAAFVGDAARLSRGYFDMPGMAARPIVEGEAR